MLYSCFSPPLTTFDLASKLPPLEKEALRESVFTTIHILVSLEGGCESFRDPSQSTPTRDCPDLRMRYFSKVI
jgi:hypothetical protein